MFPVRCDSERESSTKLIHKNLIIRLFFITHMFEVEKLFIRTLPLHIFRPNKPCDSRRTRRMHNGIQ